MFVDDMFAPLFCHSRCHLAKTARDLIDRCNQCFSETKDFGERLSKKSDVFQNLYFILPFSELIFQNKK
jgi:hypothetical protein